MVSAVDPWFLPVAVMMGRLLFNWTQTKTAEMLLGKMLSVYRFFCVLWFVRRKWNNKFLIYAVSLETFYMTTLM